MKAPGDNQTHMNSNQSSMGSTLEQPHSSSHPGDVTFDARWIAEIKSEHARLVSLFSNLEKIASAQPNLIVADLIVLRELFQQQRFKERLYFHTYLDRMLVSHASLLEQALAVWKEMEKIASSVDQFIADWVACPPVTHMLPIFVDQLQRTMKALVVRIELQEGALHSLSAKLSSSSS